MSYCRCCGRHIDSTYEQDFDFVPNEIVVRALQSMCLRCVHVSGADRSSEQLASMNISRYLIYKLRAKKRSYDYEPPDLGSSIQRLCVIDRMLVRIANDYVEYDCHRSKLWDLLERRGLALLCQPKAVLHMLRKRYRVKGLPCWDTGEETHTVRNNSWLSEFMEDLPNFLRQDFAHLYNMGEQMHGSAWSRIPKWEVGVYWSFKYEIPMSTRLACYKMSRRHLRRGYA